MDNILKVLYNHCYSEPENTPQEMRIKVNHQLLRQRLSKRNSKLVLRIIDDKDQICTDVSLDSFIFGFRLAWQIANQVVAQAARGFESILFRQARINTDFAGFSFLLIMTFLLSQRIYVDFGKPVRSERLHSFSYSKSVKRIWIQFCIGQVGSNVHSKQSIYFHNFA